MTLPKPGRPWRGGAAALLVTVLVSTAAVSAAAAAPDPRPGPSPVPVRIVGPASAVVAVTEAASTPGRALAAKTAPSTSVSPTPPGTPTPVPTPTPTASPTRGGDGIVAADGTVNAAAYRRMAKRFATPAGIAYRFGRSSAQYGTATEGRPTAPKPADRVRDNRGHHPNGTYQVAGPQDPSKDDYSSNQGQLGYLSTQKRRTIGVDHLETLSMGENTFSEKPQLSWTYYGDGHPEPDFIGSSAPAACMARLGVRPGRFVAQARAYAHGESTANSLVVFDNGVIAAAGTNTARGQICLKLPKALEPTAISVTNGNEFALITAWNTTTLKSELAVVALGGRQAPGAFWNNEWTELYPGLQNYGMPTFAKLLGSIELPVAAAVGVSAVSNRSMGQWLSRPDGSNVLPGQFALSDEANRQTFVSGPNRSKRPTAGYAVVFSRSERATVFVDLQPLFSKVTGAYFRSRAEFDAAARSVGTAKGKWPQAFSVKPSSAPKVVKTVRTKSAPTAVAAMLSGAQTPRAYVATENGRLIVFAVGGLASAKPATAAGIVRKGAIRVGRNPTSITYVKDRGTGGVLPQSLDRTLIVTSRGDRKVQWVDLQGSGGQVVRTLQDSRLVDPIAVEDNNTHGTESYVLSVADYGAGRLFNYRYGPVIFHTNGGARYGLPNGGFEFGGAYNPKGRPFSISVTNVT